MNAAVVVAEIGCNHQGSMDKARELIRTAAQFAQAPVVKFQKRNPGELLSPEEFAKPHPVARNAFGETYGEHRAYLELSVEQHRELQGWCRDYGTGYACSVWDITSAREIMSIEPEWIKIPSACNLNRPLLELLAREFAGPIHISLGMTTRDEVQQIVALMDDLGRAKDIVLYVCTSGYPVAFEDVCLGELPRLRQDFGDTVSAIGFSGHHLGIAVDIAALALGAQFIERHYTLDRTMKGTDHAASLEPDGLRRLVRDVRNVGLALGEKRSDMLPVEEEQRVKLKSGQIRWR
ncbi:MAG: N-acetylneuraminate synthase family protein [Sphingomonadales bacterium]|nr:N-acetylneuraminate synthase family protein [Sphingomonadales bacterium]